MREGGLSQDQADLGMSLLTPDSSWPRKTCTFSRDRTFLPFQELEEHMKYILSRLSDEQIALAVFCNLLINKWEEKL